MTHRDEFEELLGAYALDACDAPEAAALAIHLAECPRCRAELAAHLEVAGVLGNLGGEAPAGLWDRIWGEIASAEQAGQEPAHGGATGSSRLPDSVSHPPPPLGVIEGIPDAAATATGSSGGAGANPHRSPASERAKRRWSYALVAGAVAVGLAVAVAVLGATVVSLNNEVSALNKAVVTGGVRGAEQAALADPRHIAVQLASATRRWRAQLVILPSGEAFIVPEKMPTIPTSTTFQAWAIVRGKAVSLGVLGRSGQIHQLLLQPDMTAVLVNTEPLGGAAQPTTPPLLTGHLPTTL